ncbi:MAG: 16S rRNA (uracil(1498)-N(3))-methyltransferase [Planctomycetota bacterium]
MSLGDEESRHALRVLRLSEHDPVELIDGVGTTAQATLAHASGGRAVCVVVALIRQDPPRPHLTLATAIPKGPRGDAMVNDLAQLGVDELVPLRTQRSVVDPRDNKLARYRRAAIQAAKQCGRAWVMRVRPTMDLATALDLQSELVLVADPAGKSGPDAVGRVNSVNRVLAFVGPEGGLTDTETELAVKQGAVLWRFNTHVLRVETAAAAAVAILRSTT